MIRSRRTGLASPTEDRKAIGGALASKFTRSTSNSRARLVDRKPVGHKRLYEAGELEIASHYLYCIKEPPCQTCCGYNERLFKTLLHQKRKYPPYKHRISDYAYLTPAIIYHGRPDEEIKTYDINATLCYQNHRGTDVTAATRSIPPAHPFHPDVRVTSPLGRENCDVTKPSEAACSGTKSPSRDYCYYGIGVEATDVAASRRKISPPRGRPDDKKKGKEFFGRPKSDVTNFNSLPSRIPEGIIRYHGVPIGKSILDPCRDYVPLPSDASGMLLAPVGRRNSSPLSQPTSPTKVYSRSLGEANWRKTEEKEFFSLRSRLPWKPCTETSTPDRNESKLQRESSLEKSFNSPKTGSASLFRLSRVSEDNSCADSALSLLRRPALSPCYDRTLLLATSSSGKLPEPPPTRNTSAAKPPRPPPRTHAVSPISAIPPLSAPGRPRDRDLVERKIVCKHPPCKPCNVSCFDQYYSPNRTRDFNTSYDKPCTLPDIFARRNLVNFSSRSLDDSKKNPIWKMSTYRSSPWRFGCSQTSYGRSRDTAHNTARLKAAIERDIYSGPPKSQKRMYGKAQWKQFIETGLLANR